jgi:triacylglycerol lipase
LWQHFKSSGHPRKNINVITFAAPAAGNESFADDFDKKFPNTERLENKNDIVPKVPCTSAVSGLGDLFDSTLQASKINVGYKNVTMPLNKVFDLLSTALMFLEFTNGNAVYKQPGGKGKQITISLSGKNKSGDISSWLGEAGYQHGVARYAAQLGVPVVDCENK